ncbi:uncharacterized protein [Procambarus clarkii]|uniref:uncharacterized protein n=1 Tax=Procambarus clarkii TaxID=6728 RepID=UPI003743EA22
MADKLSTKIKGLFESDNTKVQQNQRGVPTDKKELFAWRNTKKFIYLPPRGQEAFFKYLRGDSYSEDKDIIDIDVRASGVSHDARRYQFWLKTKEMHLSNLFNSYVYDDTRLLEVDKILPKPTNVDYAENARNIDDFVEKLIDMMEPYLDQKFTEFKEALENLYGKNGENIK